MSAWRASRSCSSPLDELNAYPGSPMADTPGESMGARQPPSGRPCVLEAEYCCKPPRRTRRGRARGLVVEDEKASASPREQERFDLQARRTNFVRSTNAGTCSPRACFGRSKQMSNCLRPTRSCVVHERQLRFRHDGAIFWIQRLRARKARFFRRLPHTAISHQWPCRLRERS